MTIHEKTEIKVYRKVKDIVDTLKREKEELIERGRQRFNDAVKRKDYVAADNAQYLVNDFENIVNSSYATFREMIIENYSQIEVDRLAPGNPIPFFTTMQMAWNGSEKIIGKVGAMSRYLSLIENKYRNKLENIINH